MTRLQKLPNSVGDLGKIIVATSFEWLPKVQKIAQSGHTDLSSSLIISLQDQSGKLYHGFKVGHLLRLNEQTLSMVLLVFLCALWMTVLIEKVN